MPIAVKTREREILKNAPATMLSRDYVIDMKRQRVDMSRKVTILASLLGALPDFPDNIPVHVCGRSAGLALSASLALDLITASRFPTCR